jgi:hypothetical protein
MTPKEKAIELVDKYKFYLGNEEENIKEAIDLALIAVDLAIEVETNIFKGKVNKSYWQEVKQEIENYEKD